jgi:3-oxoacyl-[acyl-carrier-protein] synthase III
MSSNLQSSALQSNLAQTAHIAALQTWTAEDIEVRLSESSELIKEWTLLMERTGNFLQIDLTTNDIKEFLCRKIKARRLGQR